MTLLTALLRTACLYGAATWLYVVGFQIFNTTCTQCLYEGIAWWLPWARMDYFGELGFGVMLGSFFLLNLRSGKQ